MTLHSKTPLRIFPVPRRDVTNQTLPGRDNLFSDTRAGDGKSITFNFAVFSNVYASIKILLFEKMLSIFQSPAGISLAKFSLAGNIILGQREFG